MKKIVPAFLLLFPLFVNAPSRHDEKTFVNPQFTIDIGLSGLRFGYEFVSGNKQTVLLRGDVAPVVYNLRYDGAGSRELVAAVNLSAEYRVYINFEKRSDVGKDVSNNGADYL